MVKSSVFPKAINIIGERKDPFRNLWRNVLITALEDALGRRINEGFNTHFAKGAQEYFTYPNQDFKLVCDFAGFDHKYIRMKAEKAFAARKKIYDQKNMHSMQR